MNQKHVLILLTISVISGCATVSECDPAIKKNTATTVGCIVSGNYGTRQKSLEVQLQEEKALSETLRQIYALLEIEQRGVSGNLASTKAQYRQLNNTLNNLISQIKANSQGNQALQQKIANLQSKMSDVNNTASSTKKQLALNSLYTEVDSLKKELGYN